MDRLDEEKLQSYIEGWNDAIYKVYMDLENNPCDIEKLKQRLQNMGK